jgi:amino acid transporter
MNRISVFFIIFIKKYFFEKIMPRNNKFSAFAGVYTPSLLTILGVIMYMRLGWVVGEAGLINALIIIVVAHIISVTTGLSISSIATDKKIKAGGIYYMLSRSLGLPMGGAIGIALFVGTALSISMYVIGFAESFLSIPSISQFLHLSPSIESYQIVGTAVIILLVILAFISTSLAIKSQFLILGAIVLSLISIAVGFFINPQFIPENPIMHIANGDVSLEYVFSIFFPAVTGFTAGVAMSGDLRNPKKGIPTGTLLSILTGFIVYLGLAVGFAYFVNRDALINNTDIAMRVSWIPGLVVAGIWGATLSSALGGILGGPRIIQAIASDRLMPRIFSKGYGETNEPRNALLLIFVIAELGILKGNLNAIAGIVTMFYLATYGFINLFSFVLIATRVRTSWFTLTTTRTCVFCNNRDV